METSCAFCHRERAAKRCTRCKAVRYCGPECQKKHWQVHRASCRLWSDRSADAVGMPFGKEEPSLVVIPERGRRTYPREIDGLLKQWKDNAARADSVANEKILIRVIRELDSRALYLFMMRTGIRAEGLWFSGKTAAYDAFIDAWKTTPTVFMALMLQASNRIEDAKIAMKVPISRLLALGGTKYDAIAALKDLIEGLESSRP